MNLKKIKYCGFFYNGNNYSYKLDEHTILFDDPYDALSVANKNWDLNPDNQISRLLVVFKVEISEEKYLLQCAFFQFTNSKECCSFVSNRNEIVWSSNDKPFWNGNANLMK